MGKIKILIYIFALFTVFHLKANKRSNIAEEVSIKETSSTFFVKQDSLFNSKYKKILDFYRKKEFIDALKGALNLYDEIEEYGNSEYSYKTTSLIADIYDKTNKYSNSLKYYKNSIKVLNGRVSLENKTFSFDSEFAKTLLRIGSAFQKLQNIDSAKFYYKKIEELTSLNNETLGFKAASYNNLSGIYEKDSLFNEAKNYSNKAIEAHEKRNDKAGQATALNNLGNIYLSLGNFEKAKDIYI